MRHLKTYESYDYNEEQSIHKIYEDMYKDIISEIEKLDFYWHSETSSYNNTYSIYVFNNKPKNMNSLGEIVDIVTKLHPELNVSYTHNDLDPVSSYVTISTEIDDDIMDANELGLI